MSFSHRLLSSNVSFAAKPAPEIERIGSMDGSVLVVPVGSTEQHGEHLPVTTDTLLATAVTIESAERVAETAPVLVTPPVWSGYSPHHLPLGGTLTADFETLLDLLSETADAGLANGFDALLFVNGHGGNTPLIEAAVSKIGRDRSVETLGLTYFELVTELTEAIRESDVGGMAHGGEFETSLMMHLYPGLVNTEEAPATYRDEHYDRAGQDLMVGGPLSVYRTFDHYSESGAIGDPDLANETKGKQLFDGITTELADLIGEIHTKNE